MRELHVVATSEDGRHVVLATSKNASSGGFKVALDDRLAAAVRGDLPRPGESQPAVVTPKEIQARLRAGESPEQIAASAGVPVAKIERYAGPVLSERERVLDQARAGYVSRSRLGQSALPLGEAVDRHLAETTGVRPETVVWSTRREEAGTWLVELSYVSQARRRTAAWRYDVAHREVTPTDNNSAVLAHVEPGRRSRSHLEPASPPVAAPARTSTRSKPASRARRAPVRTAAPATAAPGRTIAARPAAVPARVVAASAAPAAANKQAQARARAAQAEERRRTAEQAAQTARQAEAAERRAAEQAAARKAAQAAERKAAQAAERKAAQAAEAQRKAAERQAAQAQAAKAAKAAKAKAVRDQKAAEQAAAAKAAQEAQAAKAAKAAQAKAVREQKAAQKAAEKAAAAKAAEDAAAAKAAEDAAAAKAAQQAAATAAEPPPGPPTLRVVGSGEPDSPLGRRRTPKEPPAAARTAPARVAGQRASVPGWADVLLSTAPVARPGDSDPDED